jgi:hypothetical protein
MLRAALGYEAEGVVPEIRDACVGAGRSDDVAEAISNITRLQRTGVRDRRRLILAVVGSVCLVAVGVRFLRHAIDGIESKRIELAPGIGDRSRVVDLVVGERRGLRAGTEQLADSVQFS